jgi:hypothetical protein
MAKRVHATALRYGLDTEAAMLLESAYQLAMQPRRALPESDPARLHPARTVLILCDSVTDAAPMVLAAAALAESQDDHLAVDVQRIERQLNDRVSALVAAVPRPADAGEELLEHLLVAPLAVRHIALAEQLDHARHLHLCPPSLWAPRHELVGRAYLPVAEREGGTLARRFRWWHDMFARRYLPA